jgi:hypothetical protein
VKNMPENGAASGGRGRAPVPTGESTQGARVVAAEGQTLAQQVVDEATRRAVDELLPTASPQQKKAVATLIAPWAERLVRALDDLIRIPGTKIGIGLDALLGFLFPGAGDWVTGLSSVSLLFLALKHRVPTVAIARMLMNILIDTVVGTLPLVGDAFDVFWKSNRKNLEIIEKYKNDPKQRPSPGDYALVGLGVVLAVASAVLPTLMFFLFGAALVTAVGGLLGSPFGHGGGHP